MWVFQRLFCILLPWQISSLNLCLYFLVGSHMPVGEFPRLSLFVYFFFFFTGMNGTTFTHTYSWVSIDSVTTYEGLIVFHRSRMPSGIGTCWHLPCYERPWHLSWTYKVLSFPSFQSSKFFKFLSFEAVVMAFMLYPFFSSHRSVFSVWLATLSISFCMYEMHYYCCRSSQLCVQKGLCVSVSGSEGSLFMCVPVLLYAHMNISVHLCIVVFWNKWNWVSVSAAQDGRSLYCSNINMNIWTCPCAGSCVSEGAMLVLLLGYLGTVNWSPSWVSRLLESLGNQDLNLLKPPKTHLLIVPLLCWQHLESSIVIRRVYC